MRDRWFNPIHVRNLLTPSDSHDATLHACSPESDSSSDGLSRVFSAAVVIVQRASRHRHCFDTSTSLPRLREVTLIDRAHHSNGRGTASLVSISAPARMPSRFPRCFAPGLCGKRFARRRARATLKGGRRRDPQVRARGMPGARCTRSLACDVKMAHELVTTGSPGHPALPARWF
jgi:hypothetical protein